MECICRYLKALFSPVSSHTVICQDYDESIYRPSIAITVHVLSDDQRSVVDTCFDVFNREVDNSDALKTLFDLSRLRGLEISHVAYDDFVAILKYLKADNPEAIADFSTRSMRNNFDFYKEDVMCTVYSSIICNYAYTQRVLTQKNAEDIGLKFAIFFKESAKKHVQEGDIISRFQAITQGIIKSLDFIGPFFYERSLMLAFLFEIEWLLRAIGTQYSTKLFHTCSVEVDGDSK
ncbi:uncharacterized protein NPIL_282031 [Nephila pilipes]|uniref:Uncharacterized protein n=1 Tax=Nephila pilipes TaxID=299642 RepID=A0A8X6TQJ4_NEPPI|nr:uncharacterized protein NPIL_282031 [Nephila pilipes]